MKSKYSIIRDRENKQLIIKEYAELDKHVLTFVCEQAYSDKIIKSAISKGSEELISAMRTINFYPSGVYGQGLAEAIIELYRDKSSESVEVSFDDLEFLPKTRAKKSSKDDIDNEAEEIEEEIDDEFAEKYEEEPGIKKIDSSLSIADEDNYDDLDDEK